MDRSFSERTMKFPIRLYKSDDIEEHDRRVENLGLEEEEIEYAVGYVRVCPYDIIEWYTCFSRPRSIQDVKRNGFDSTRFKTKSGEFYDCVWEAKEFEARCDQWVMKFEREVEESMAAQEEEKISE